MASGTDSTPSAPAPTPEAPEVLDGPHLYDENGVDLTLVRYSLNLTPTERLKTVENFMNLMATVKPAPPIDAEPTDESEREG